MLRPMKHSNVESLNSKNGVFLFGGTGEKTFKRFYGHDASRWTIDKKKKKNSLPKSTIIIKRLTAYIDMITIFTEYWDRDLKICIMVTTHVR